VKLFRPFPTADLRRALAGVADVAVLDRNISPGHSGIFAEETRAALYDLPAGKRPRIHGYIVGLGGRDVTPATILDCIARARAAARPEAELEREDVWVGVKS
jgi:pyruvate/2-oxoacid:ferredoxin oxidoreductase alpha subunit